MFKKENCPRGCYLDHDLTNRVRTRRYLKERKGKVVKERKGNEWKRKVVFLKYLRGTVCSDLFPTSRPPVFRFFRVVFSAIHVQAKFSSFPVDQYSRGPFHLVFCMSCARHLYFVCLTLAPICPAPFVCLTLGVRTALRMSFHV
jgi:hypothetical protein